MPTTTTTIEELALDGPLSVPWIVLIGLFVAVMLAWALWRERHILGHRLALLFFGLRALAVATVFWMLLAPASHRVEVSTTRQAVEIVADVTDSMTTVDPPGRADDLRWTISASGDDQLRATRWADEAVAAIGLAHRNLQLTVEALRQHRSEAMISELASSANQALDHAKAHLTELVEQDQVTLSERSESLVQRLTQALEDSEFQSFTQLSSALEKGRTPSEKGWRESLPDLQQRIAGLQRTMRELAREVLNDTSRHVSQENPELLASMSQSSRKQRVGQFLQELQQSTLSGLEETADLRLSAFDSQVAKLPSLSSLIETNDSERSASSANGTNLTEALEYARRQKRDQPVAAVFLLTDVAHNQRSESSPQDIARTLDGSPVYVVPIGNTDHVRDIALRSVSAPAVAMRNDDVIIEATLEAYDCDGEVCHVALLQDGDVIDVQEIVFDSTYASRTVQFEQRVPEIGYQSFQISIDPLEGELTDANNLDEVEVNVTRSDIKVLLADELPRWEYRYLAQLFRRDPKIECDELLYRPRLIASGRREESKTLPVTVDEWDQYDVVILGDLPTDRFPVASQESLEEYLQKRGGTAIFIAGSRAMPGGYVNHPLEALMPVTPIDSSQSFASSLAFRVTPAGEAHDALMIAETESATRTAWEFVNQYAPLGSVSQWRQPRPSAETLIAAVPRNNMDAEQAMQSSAFLCWQRIGRGRVVYLSGPDTYRLRFLRGDRLHYRFWGQLLRWAIAADLSTGTELVRLRTNRSRYQTGESVEVTVQLSSNDGEPVVASDLTLNLTSGDDIRSVPLIAAEGIPGEYRAEVRSLPSGVYRLEPTGDAIRELKTENSEESVASLTVYEDISLEMVDTRSDRALAQQIASLTGGQVLPPTAVSEILALTNLEPIVTEKVIRKPLWLQWKYLWLIFGCLQIEWIIRKWYGLS